MLFSRSAITLLSSVGASSIPVVSVVVLYHIKNSSLGNNVEAVSSISKEDNIISLPETVSPKIEPSEENTKTEGSVPEPPEEEAEVTITNSEDSSPQSSGDISVASTSPSPDDESNEKQEDKKSDDSVTPKITNISDLDKLAKTIIENIDKNNDQTPNNADIKENIDNFVQLLTSKKSEIKDQSENSEIDVIIEALKKLKEKIN